MLGRQRERESARSLDKPCIYDDIDKGIVISPLQIASFSSEPPPPRRRSENKQLKDNLGRLMYGAFVWAYTARTHSICALRKTLNDFTSPASGVSFEDYTRI